MLTNTSTQLPSPSTEYYAVMVNATNDESTFKTLTKGTDQLNLYYTPYNETIPITGTWNTVNQVIDYKYTPANWNTDIELQENKSKIIMMSRKMKLLNSRQ